MNEAELKDYIIRHQVLLERFKTAQALEAMRIVPEVRKAIEHIMSEVSANSLNEISKNELWALLSELRKEQYKIINKSNDLHVKSLQELAGYEAASEAALISHMTKGTMPKTRKKSATYFPTLKEAWKSAINEPVRATGQLLEPFIRSWGDSHVAGVEGAIMKGYSDGLTIGQIMQGIRGTKANGFKDGLMAISGRHAEAIARTAVQHVSQRSRMATWEANDDLVSGFTFVATLDSRTTSQCRSLDGKVFPLGKGPVPPVHVNCRSTTIPKLHSDFDFLDEGATRAAKGGPVDAKQTYYDWLKTQPESVVAEALGKAKAKDFLAGKITAADFDAKNLGRTFAPMSLAEMKEAEKKVFSLAKEKEEAKKLTQAGNWDYESGSKGTPSDRYDYYDKVTKFQLSRDKLDEEVGDAIQWYQGYGYANLNDFLREGKVLSPKDYKTADEYNLMKNLDIAMRKNVTDRDLILFRGIDKGIFNFDKPFEFEDKAFVSASTGAQGSFAKVTKDNLIIKLPKGSNAIGVGAVTGRKDELEILLPRGGKFVYVGNSRKVNNTTFYELEYIQAEAPKG